MNNNYYKWFSTCGRYTVYLSKPCLDKIYTTAKEYLPNEIGTSLIGYYSDDGFEAFVEELAPVSSDSLSSRFSFVRGTKGLKKFYKNLSKRHLNKLYYVGEWHSHPSGSTMSSHTDDKNQFAISNDINTNCPESILIIIGQDISISPKYNIYVYSRKNEKICLYEADK